LVIVTVAPLGTKLFGIVTFPKPIVPLSPVTEKDNVFEIPDWLVAIVTLDICELVMLPLIGRSTVNPLSVSAFTVVSNGVGEGDGFAVGVGMRIGVGTVVGIGVSKGIGVSVGVGIGVGESVGEGDGVGDRVGSGDGVGVTVGVEVGVEVGVGDGEGLGVGLRVGDVLGVGVGVAVGVGTGVGRLPRFNPWFTVTVVIPFETI
jgi:hypothetical protein